MKSSIDLSISGLLPVKNGEKYLNHLLPQIFRMLEKDDELIVINDGSNDATGQILERFCTLERRLKVETTAGLGLVQALNLGISRSDKSWIARFDVDDTYSMNRLKEQKKYISEDVAVVFSDYRFVSKFGTGLGVVKSAVFPSAVAASLISSQRTAHPSALINKESLLKVGGFFIEDFPAEDLGLWLRLSKLGLLVSVPQTLLNYQLNGASISSQNRRKQISKKNELIRNFDSWENHYRAALHDLEKNLKQYSLLEGGTTRIFLHLREMRMIESNLQKSKEKFGLIKIVGFKSTNLILLSALKSIIFGILRRFYRIISKFF